MHKVILINAASSRTEHQFESIDEAHGSCGSKLPLIYNGKAGFFEFITVDSTVTRFVETDPIFAFFEYRHLPEHLQKVSKRFYEIAEWMVLEVPRNAERTAGLRKLLESKDCAVRAALAR